MIGQKFNRLNRYRVESFSFFGEEMFPDVDMPAFSQAAAVYVLKECDQPIGVAPSMWCVSSSVGSTYVFGASTIWVLRIGAADINEITLNKRPALRIVAVSFLLKSPIG